MTLIDRLLRRRRIYDDLSSEMQAHLEERIDDLVAQGMSHDDASAAARRAFGNVTRLTEEARDPWQWPMIESFLMDLRFALRQLRRSPAFTTIIVLTLAVGIASTTTVFSWTRTILLDPLPGAGHPERVEALESTTESGRPIGTSWLDFRDYGKYLTSFSGLTATYPTSLAVGDAKQSTLRWGELVSANFFDVLEVRPALGRFFPARLDSVPTPVVVISYDLWKSRFRGEQSAIGTSMEINRYPFTIIGVAPRGFHGSMPGLDLQLWIPATTLGQIVPTGGWMLQDRATRMFRVLARIAPGVDPAVARQEVQRFGALMARANPVESEGVGGVLLPLWRSHLGAQDSLRAPLLVLLGACGLVLLIVCANMANLLLARAMGRRREFGLRLALGAPRRRLVRQLLTETSLLVVAGSALGLVCSVWLAEALPWMIPTFASPTFTAPRFDAGVLMFTGGLAVAVTILAGIAPALHGTSGRVGEALNDGGSRGAVGAGAQVARLRGLLVGGEMALAVVALVGAGLFHASFRQASTVSPGFSANQVAMGSVSLALAGYDSARAYGFMSRVSDNLRQQPGVTAVSYTDYVPMSVSEGSWEPLRVEGYAPQAGESMKVYRAAVGPDFFKTMQIPFVSGREFRIDDDSAHAPVMIVNREFVARFLGGRASIGMKVNGWGRWFTIVGVVENVKNYRLTDPPTPYFYVPMRQVYRPEYGYTFVVRSTLPVDQAAADIRRAVNAVDPTVPVFNTMPLEAYIEVPLRVQQAAAQMLGLLAGVAQFLAAIGLYGVIAYSVAQRTREIGVRIALGARPANVLRVIAAQAGALLAWGLLAGIVASVMLGRVVSAMLFAVSPADITVFASAALTMMLVAVAATSVPALQAIRVDPAITLRDD